MGSTPATDLLDAFLIYDCCTTFLLFSEPSQLHMDVSAVVSVMAFLTAIVTVAIVLFYFGKNNLTLIAF